MISGSGFFKKVKNKYCKFSLQSRAAFWFTVCNFIVKSLNFLFAPVFSRLLSPDQYGVISVYNAYQQILIILATMELYYGAYNKGYVKYHDNLNEFTFSLMTLSNLITICLFTLVFLGKNIYMRYTQLGTDVLILSFAMFLVRPAFYCWIAKHRFEYKYQSVVAATITFSFASLIIPALAVVLVGATAEVNIVTTLIVSIFFYGPFYVLLLKQNINSIRLENTLSYWKYCLTFQLPLVIHSLSFLVLGQSDRIMIGEMVSDSAAGVYSVSYTVASLATLFQTSINQAYQPFRYNCLKEKKYKEFSHSTNNIMLFLSLVIIAFSLVAPEIVRLLFQEDYQEAIGIIPAVIASSFFMFLYSVFVDVETYYEKTKYVMYASCGCAVLNIVLNYFAITYLDYRACGYTTLFSYVVFAFMHYLLMKRACISNNVIPVFINAKSIVIFSCLILIFEFVITVFYDSWLLRYALLIILIIIVIKNWNIVMNIRKEAD